MFLSRLEIFGFKTFAQKVDLRFDAGITNIVGPNGCGKSNVVDALRWVLGEQKSSVLRSEKMENVIFNGTKQRKPLNLAEVSVTVENTRGVLPTEYSEVTISRRIYRSGESEYFLNRLPCRLKDINDLFMDTGMGADAYSVIELKMVEQILSDNTEDRRKLFEEAAGITKYKIRRRQTFRKLDSTKQDLTRVNDIITEIEKKVNSLKRQTQKANRYTRLANELKWEDVRLAQYDHEALHARLSPIEERLHTLDQNANEIQGVISKKEAELEDVQTTLIAKEQGLRQAQLDLEAADRHIKSVEEQILIARERKSHLEELIRRYGSENLELREKQSALSGKIDEWTRSIGTLEAEFRKKKEDYETRRSEMDTFEQQVSLEKEKLEQVRRQLVQLIDETAKKRNAHQLTRNNIQNAEKRIHDLESAGSTEPQDAGRLEQARVDHRALASHVDHLRRRIGETTQLVEQVRHQLDMDRSRKADQEAEIKTLRGKISILQKAIESHEGFPESVRFLLDHHADTLASTAADWISVESPYQTAIESVLGESFAFLIAKGTSGIREALTRLAEAKRGSATFLDASKLPATTPRRDAGLEGKILAWAANACQAREKRLVEFLLGDVAIVRDFEQATGLADAFPHVRFVTLDGEVVQGNYLIKGGGPREDAAHMIGQRENLGAMSIHLSALEKAFEELQDSIRSEESQVQDLQRTLQQQQQELRTRDAELIQLDKSIAQQEYEQRRSIETAERQKNSIEETKRELAQFHEQLQLLQPEIDRLEQTRGETEQSMRQMDGRVQELEKERRSRLEIVQAAQSSAWTLESQIRQLQSHIDNSRQQIAEHDQTIARHEQESVLSQDEIRRIEGAFREQDADLSHRLQSRDQKEKDRDAESAQVMQIRESTQKMDAELKKVRRQRDELLNSRHDLEQEVTQLRFEGRALVERIQRDYDFDLTRDQLEAPASPPEAPEEDAESVEDQEKPIEDVLADDLPSTTFDPQTARARIDEIRRKIKMLGPVNMEAFAEYQTEKERLDVLVRQRQDLLDAEGQLLQTIETINATAQKQFLNVFENIRQNFIKIFTGLFDNSEADLKLAPNEDPLEAAIDILARPTGKKTQHIALLSGGEKTLTAISLLFAIYLVKPSPFCILDEVDAPLDDTNIDKFTKILRDFSADTQFIVVTHNKRTMEAAQNIFGITMQEAGVSKVVSVSFKNRGEAASTDDIEELIRQNQVADLTQEVKDPPTGPVNSTNP